MQTYPNLSTLLNALQDGDSEIRQHAARQLREIQDPVLLPALLDALEGDDLDTRVAILDAFASFPYDGVKDALHEALQDGDWEVQWAAMRSLGIHWDDPALRKMGDPSFEKRITGLETFCKHTEPRSLPVLLACLEDEPEMQLLALEALRHFSTPEVWKAYKRLAPRATRQVQALLEDIYFDHYKPSPFSSDVRLSCDVCRAPFSYMKIHRVGRYSDGEKFLCPQHLAEYEEKIQPFEGKVKACKGCRILWPKFEINEGFCLSCRRKQYETLPAPNDGHFRCTECHKTRSSRDLCPVSLPDEPLCSRCAYQAATQTAHPPFLSARASDFLKQAYKRGYLLCERLHLFLPLSSFPPKCHYIDLCVSSEETRKRAHHT